MNIISRLKYGLLRLFGELFGKEDYWHVDTPARVKDKYDLNTYHLDLTKKSAYPFTIRDNIPIVVINGVETELVITILNYGLGLIDTDAEKNKGKLISITQWLIANQESDGSWKTNYADKTYHLESGWYSGMVQGLAVSFFIRMVHLKLIGQTSGEEIIENALACMLSDKTTTVFNDQKIIDEYGGTSTCVLNGFIFSLISLWDYGIYKNDFTLFKIYENSLKNILKYYNFGLWSYYDVKGTIASAFYHRLHIHMLKWLNMVSPDNIYSLRVRKWQMGLKMKIIYVMIKAFQKFRHLSKMDTLNT